jgi:hypothetical protein
MAGGYGDGTYGAGTYGLLGELKADLRQVLAVLEPIDGLSVSDARLMTVDTSASRLMQLLVERAT